MAYGATGSVPSAAEAQGRNTNSIMAGFVDRGPWQYWDTAICPANTQLQSEYNMFAIPIGAQNPVTGIANTKLITNMRAPNNFPPPRCLLLFSIQFYFSSQMLKSDIDAILDSGYFEFKIDDKIFHEGQLYNYPAGAGLMGVTTNNGEEVYTNGLPSPQSTRRFDDWSKYIAPLQTFYLNIFFPGTPPTMSANGFGWYMKITLDGLTDRSVQ